MATKLKDPNATLDYKMDWSDWLASGETISSRTVIVPAGITKVSDTADATSVTFRLSGGVVGQDYAVTTRITTSTGQIDDRTVKISVVER